MGGMSWSFQLFNETETILSFLYISTAPARHSSVEIATVHGCSCVDHWLAKRGIEATMYVSTRQRWDAFVVLRLSGLYNFWGGYVYSLGE